MELTLRKDRVLASVVTGYIRTGEPVGSKAIAEEIGVSSATVRSEMASLTELGLLEQPHTSAGRVPSQLGYREFIDRLMKTPELSPWEQGWIDSQLGPEVFDPEQVLARTGAVLARLSRCAAAVTTPGGAGAEVKAVQLVQTGRRTAMLLLMSSAGTIKSRVFRCDYDLTGDILRVFFRAFNEKVTGLRVADITPASLQSLGASMGELYSMVGAPLRALLEAADDTAHTETLLSGQMNLLLYPELEPAGVRRILDLLERWEVLEPLLAGPRGGHRPGRAAAIIGTECGWPELEQASMVSARYCVGGRDAGALAVIGPVRLDYPHIMALLEYVSGRVTEQLTELDE